MDFFKILTTGAKIKRPNLNRSNESVLVVPTADSADEYRKSNNIDIEGEDVPNPVTTFEDLINRYKLRKEIVSNLSETGYLIPTPVQAQAIPLMLEGREVICSAPTGSGKTLAFLLPIVHSLREPKSIGFRALVLAPTRELAKQIHREFLWVSRGTGLRIYVMNNLETAMNKLGTKSKLKRDVLISTPMRLIKLLKQDPPVFTLKHLRWLVVDECDRLFDNSLRDQLAYIYNASCKSKKVRRAMFSATFSDELCTWFKANLDNVVTLVIGGKNCAADTVKQELLFTGNHEGKLLALQNLLNAGIEAPVVIFVDQKETAERVFKKLIKNGVNAECMHSQRSQGDRDTIVRSFREGKVMFLVTTELMARGVDFKAVNTVINYDAPRKATNYIHRIGRTGRAGRRGKAITFMTEEDSSHMKPILRVMRKSGCHVPHFLLAE